jgi:hypothetical protein
VRSRQLAQPSQIVVEIDCFDTTFPTTELPETFFVYILIFLLVSYSGNPYTGCSFTESFSSDTFNGEFIGVALCPTHPIKLRDEVCLELGVCGGYFEPKLLFRIPYEFDISLLSILIALLSGIVSSEDDILIKITIYFYLNPFTHLNI